MTTTSAGTFSSSAERRHESWLIALVSAAHFISHYYIILLAPLFVFIRADYGVSYTQLGFAFVAFNVVTALLQTPAGFLVDRIGAKPLLVAGVALGAVAITVAALVDSFWIFVAMFGVAGLANTVYHPADYTLLSQGVSHERMGRAFSIHTFAGWRGAFLGAALLGFIIAAVLALSGDLEARRLKADKAADRAAAGAGTSVLVVDDVAQNLELGSLALSAGLARTGRSSATPAPRGVSGAPHH